MHTSKLGPAAQARLLKQAVASRSVFPRAQVEQGLSAVFSCERRGLRPMPSSQLRRPVHLLKLLISKDEVHPAEVPKLALRPAGAFGKGLCRGQRASPGRH